MIRGHSPKAEMVGETVVIERLLPGINVLRTHRAAEIAPSVK